MNLISLLIAVVISLVIITVSIPMITSAIGSDPAVAPAWNTTFAPITDIISPIASLLTIGAMLLIFVVIVGMMAGMMTRPDRDVPSRPGDTPRIVEEPILYAPVPQQEVDWTPKEPEPIPVEEIPVHRPRKYDVDK